jgi:hypothetical protein
MIVNCDRISVYSSGFIKYFFSSGFVPQGIRSATDAVVSEATHLLAVSAIDVFSGMYRTLESRNLRG